MRRKCLLILASVDVGDCRCDDSCPKIIAIFPEGFYPFEDHPLIKLLSIHSIEEFFNGQAMMAGQTKRETNIWPAF